MKFTYQAYEKLIENILQEDYSICSYTEQNAISKECILRHDVDMDLEKGMQFSDFEKEIGVLKSTYFVLLTSDFYNLQSAQSAKYLDKIIRNGHEIGLHFDETRYDNMESEEAFKEKVYKEAEVIEEITGKKVRVVSMHRPSKAILDSHIEFENIINSYSKEFFENYKYISDSRMNWKQEPNEIIKSQKFQKVHILSHPFWYQQKEIDSQSIFQCFFDKRENELYKGLSNNITNFDEMYERYL